MCALWCFRSNAETCGDAGGEQNWPRQLRFQHAVALAVLACHWAWGNSLPGTLSLWYRSSRRTLFSFSRPSYLISKSYCVVFLFFFSSKKKGIIFVVFFVIFWRGGGSQMCWTFCLTTITWKAFHLFCDFFFSCFFFTSLSSLFNGNAVQK